MARSNFCTHEDGDALHIKMYSRRVNFLVPSHVKNIYVQRAWLKPDQAETLQLGNESSGFHIINAYRAESISVKPNDGIEIASPSAQAIDPGTMSSPRTPVWAAARRGLCEVRDRIKPTLDRFGTLRKGGR